VNKKFVTLLLLTAAISAQDMAMSDLQESDDEATEEPSTPEEKMANPEMTPTETKYKRRVLLTIFVNESQDKNREYLGESIPEAFSAPLVKTGNFVVLNRKSVDRYLHTMGITISDLSKEENAVRLGKAAGADVVVVGKFVSVGDSVTIEAKAIDVQAGLLSVQDSEQIKTNTTMFDSINRLAERMSAPMAEKMQPMETPPPPAEVVLDEEQVIAEVKKIEEKKAAEAPRAVHEHWLWLDAGLGLLQSLAANDGNISYDGKYPFQRLNPGWSASLGYESALPDWRLFAIFPEFHYLVNLGYARFGGALDVIGTTGDTLLSAEPMAFQLATLQLALARRLAVWKFTLLPFAGFSMDYAIFSASKAEHLFSGILPGFFLGGRVVFFTFGGAECAAGYMLSLKYLNEHNTFLHHAMNLSVGYKL
jgi:TolB-like protein